MKKLAKLFALTASLTALIFSGCSNLVDDATIEGDSIKPDGSKTLTIFATGDSDSITFTPQNGRMILPDALDGNGLVFYLLGTDEISGLKITTKEVNFVGTSSDGRTGTVEVDLKTSKYKLELYAVEKAKKFSPSGTYSSDIVTLVGDATHDGVAVFKATASVDMRYNEKVSFYLTPYTLSGKGTLKLTLTTDWDIPSPYSTAGNIKYGLYDLVTGNAVTGTEQTSVAGDITSNKLAVTYVGNGATITSGTYNFKVTFINGAKNYVWSDTIVILYNRETAAAISIPNVIGVMPKEPTAFTAKFSVPENPISGYYDVEFLWEASGTNNEQYFQLELLDPADGANSTMENLAKVQGTAANTQTTTGTPDGDAVWTTIYNSGTGTATSTYDKYAYSLEEYQDGSLNANSSSIVLSLPLGKRYVARIASVNDAGTSIYTYMDLSFPDAASGTPTQWTDFVAPVDYKRKGIGNNITPKSFKDAFGANVVGINLYRVTYNFANGSYFQSTLDTTSTDDIATILSGDTDSVATDNVEIKTIGTTKATQDNIATLNMNTDATADVRYYTQLYDSTAVPNGTPLLNPLCVAGAKDAADKKQAYTLAKDGSAWTGWKFDSTSNPTVYSLNFRADRKKGLLAQPLIGTANATVNAGTGLADGDIYAASDYGAATPVAGDGSYPGYKNLSLFAVYGAATVNIFNPADYAIQDCDVLLFKENVAAAGTPSIASALQVVTLDSSNSFKVNNDTTAGFSNLYIAVRDLNYSKVSLKITSQTYGTKYEKTLNTGIAGTQQALKADRYVLITTEPSDFSTSFGNYYKKTGHSYTALAAAEPWAANKYYAKTIDASTTAVPFTYFNIPVRTDFGTGTYLIQVSGFNKNNPSAPYTYILSLEILESDTPVYSATTFEPINYSDDKAKYYTTTDGTTFTANDVDPWAAGTSTGGVWQKD